jgi:hypothetical protein
MGPRATRFALVFWMVLAVAVIILAIKPWAGARDSQSKPAAPIPAREIIYNTGKCFEDRQIVRGNPSLPDTSLPDTSLPDIGIGSIGTDTP